ncbi:hypothetical protein [Burkholderia sp. F1]|uniref:hypothetical protein n=1 Tax=Burkholderia sp. F1 TaxID=3366817 RepID=UPI003D75C070
MIRIRMISAGVAVAASVVMTLIPPIAVAQDATGAASAPPSASSAKQVRKAQRKAARKAAREKRNAELRAIEKDGYRLTGDGGNYPENFQNTERKTAPAP